MPVLKWLLCQKFSTLCLSLVSLSWVMGQALPAQAGGGTMPPDVPTSARTARFVGLRSRCPTTVSCIRTSFDFDGNGEPEAVTPMTSLAPTDNHITTTDGIVRFYLYMPQNQFSVSNEEDSISRTDFELVIDRQTAQVNLQGREIVETVYNNIENEGFTYLPEALDQGPRIITITLDNLNLEVGETYEWQLGIWCGDNDLSQLGLIEGTVTYADPSQRLSERDRWFEALHKIAPLRHDYPHWWAELLEEQGLGCFKDVPFADEEGVDYGPEDDPFCFVGESE